MIPPATSGPRATFPNLTGFRFFTCMHVAMFHLLKPAAAAAGLPEWAQNLLRASTFGFFFVLSGFLLGTAYATKVGAAEGRLRFWKRRIARIVPAYLLVLLVALPVAWRSGDPQRITQAFGAGLLLLQAWFQDLATAINGPAWSISVEMALYAAFPLLVPALRGLKDRLGFGGAFLLLWGLQVANVAYVGLAGGWGLFDLAGALRPYPIFFASHHPLAWVGPFGMGVLLAFRYQERRQLPPPRGWVALALATALGVALFLAFAPTRMVMLARLGLFSVPFSGVIYLLARGAQVDTPFNRDLAWRPLQRFGTATYSVYLIHVPLWDYLQFLTARATGLGAGRVAEHPVFVLAYLVALPVLGVLFCERVEQPLTRWAGRKLGLPGGSGA